MNFSRTTFLLLALAAALPLPAHAERKLSDPNTWLYGEPARCHSKREFEHNILPSLRAAVDQTAECLRRNNGNDNACGSLRRTGTQAGWTFGTPLQRLQDAEREYDAVKKIIRDQKLRCRD